MVFIAKISALISIMYIVKITLYPYFRPVSKKQKNRTRIYMKEREKREKQERNKRIKKQIAIKYISKFIGQAERMRLNKMIDRLDMKVTVEEIRFNQFMYTFLAIILTIFMIKINKIIGLITAMLIIIGWIYPVSILEEKIQKKNKNIALDFPAFYSMVYYQYSKSVNIHLEDVIKDYLPHANKDMEEELNYMLDNIMYG